MQMTFKVGNVYGLCWLQHCQIRTNARNSDQRTRRLRASPSVNSNGMHINTIPNYNSGKDHMW